MWRIIISVMARSAGLQSQPILLRTGGRIVAIILLIIYLGFTAACLAAGSLGGFLLFLPAVVSLGLATVWLFWRPKSWSPKLSTGLTTALLVVFAVTGWWSFHIMFKFIQPTVLPKHAVAIGNPWVIEGNVLADNDYTNPVVVRLADGSYQMYFHDHNSMLTAASADGRHFGTPAKLFDGQMPTVIQLPDGRYRMYYMVNAHPQNINQPPAPGQAPPQPHPQQMNCGDNCVASPNNLVSAISTDGLHWTQEPGVRLATDGGQYDANTIIHPSVIRMGDGTYKLYYDGETDPVSSLALVHHYRKILSASSKDGLNWTRDPGYRIDEKPVHTWEAYSPKATYEDGTVTLRFTTPNGIYQASSIDGLKFTISKNPIFTPGRIPMPTDLGALGSYQDSFVMKVPGGHRMYFWIDGKGTYSAFQKQ